MHYCRDFFLFKGSICSERESAADGNVFNVAEESHPTNRVRSPDFRGGENHGNGTETKRNVLSYDAILLNKEGHHR